MFIASAPENQTTDDSLPRRVVGLTAYLWKRIDATSVPAEDLISEMNSPTPMHARGRRDGPTDALDELHSEAPASAGYTLSIMRGLIANPLMPYSVDEAMGLLIYRRLRSHVPIVVKSEEAYLPLDSPVSRTICLIAGEDRVFISQLTCSPRTHATCVHPIIRCQFSRRPARVTPRELTVGAPGSSFRLTIPSR